MLHHLFKRKKDKLINSSLLPLYHIPVADPDLQLIEGGGGFVLLALPAFLPSVIFFFSNAK